MFSELANRYYFRPKREELLRTLGEEGVSEKTLGAMAEVQRHLFASFPQLNLSYVNKVLSIMQKPSLRKPLAFINRRKGTSLSQPWIVGMMTDLLQLQPTDKVLEIGTATGYQAAVISKLASEVVTVDVLDELCLQAKKRLNKLEIDNVHVVAADGGIPFTEEKVFDKIIVTASVPPIIPHPPLLKLLKPNGLAVMPLGGLLGDKYLCEMLSIRAGEDNYHIESRSGKCTFVPMLGRAGWGVFFARLADGYQRVLITNLSNEE
jgi:protein-L-isoaspartate(D-aspartate) O-methyltransferase